METTTFSPETVKVGDGVTFRIGSDRLACTVVKVSPSGKTVTMQRDNAKVVSGSQHDGSAKYEYEEDRNGSTYVARWSAPVSKFKMSAFGTYAGPGRHEYYDPSF